MQYTNLGHSDLSVSQVCLGTMTWGEQNTQRDADAQIAYAAEQGINFMDTAELYSVPPKPETYGATEQIIGDWLSRHPQQRSAWVIASKHVGEGVPWIRDGAEISYTSIKTAIDGSLQRLQTDYIDLYQLHWPNRPNPHFGKHWPNQIRPTALAVEAEVEKNLGILKALDEAIQAGKIRHWGLSDDTPWGIMKYLALAKEHNLARPVSIQNEFSLLHAKDWHFLLETCVYENIAYLPWSPLAGGMLSGKYIGGARPAGSRWSLEQRLGLFRNTPQAEQAVIAYQTLAQDMGITPAQLALKWCAAVDGVSSTIIGATNMTQLAEDIEAFAEPLSETDFMRINAIFKQYPQPF